MRADSVVKALGARATGRLPDSFEGVSIDSRAMSKGDLFFAIRGPRFDGHRFLGEAEASGAACAVVEQIVSDSVLPQLVVPDSGEALLALASLQRKRLKAKVVAVTGSNGKTTTKDLAARALSSRYRVVKSPHSFNNQIGVPLTLFLADNDTEMIVLEVGTNHPGEIERLARVAEPDVAVITNIAAAHLEGLGTIEGVEAEKSALLRHVRSGGFCVLNAEDASFDSMRSRATSRVVTTAVQKRADYVATTPLCSLDRIAFHLNGNVKVRVPLLGCHNLYNALTALSIAVELGCDATAAAASLSDFEAPPMRLKKTRVGKRLVIDDAYNANPGSMKAAIKTIAALDVKGRKVIVLGEMKELGEKSNQMHREVGGSLSCGEFDLVCGVGKKALEIIRGAVEHGLEQEKIIHYEDAAHCAADLPTKLKEDDTVLVKGSRAMGLEAVVASVLNSSSRLDEVRGESS